MNFLDILKAGASENDNGKEALSAMNDLMDNLISQAFSAARRQGINTPGKVLTLSNRLMVELKELLDPAPKKTVKAYPMTEAQLNRIEKLLAVASNRPFDLAGEKVRYKDGADIRSFTAWLHGIIEAADDIKNAKD